MEGPCNHLQVECNSGMLSSVFLEQAKREYHEHWEELGEWLQSSEEEDENLDEKEKNIDHPPTFYKTFSAAVRKREQLSDVKVFGTALG
eukprot:g43662.t1